MDKKMNEMRAHHATALRKTVFDAVSRDLNQTIESLSQDLRDADHELDAFIAAMQYPEANAETYEIGAGGPATPPITLHIGDVVQVLPTGGTSLVRLGVVVQLFAAHTRDWGDIVGYMRSAEGDSVPLIAQEFGADGYKGFKCRVLYSAVEPKGEPELLRQEFAGEVVGDKVMSDECVEALVGWYDLPAMIARFDGKRVRITIQEEN